MITTEDLLVSVDAYGIKTATPAQRAIARIADGLPLAEFAEYPDVISLVGGTEARDAVMAHQRDHGAPTELVVLASIRSAKTILASAAAIRMAMTVDVSELGPGEIPRVSIVSLRLDNSQVAYRILLETVRSSRLLRTLLDGEPTGNTLTLKHPSGRPIEITTVAGSAAGGTLVSRWSAGVIFDEAPRMNGASDAVVNLDHARTAVLGRLLPGAQALYIGSAWAPHGPVYDMVQSHWAKPSANMVVLRGTGPQLNPVWWTPGRCAKLQEQDPVAYQTDVMGEFADPEAGLLNPISVRRNTRESPLQLSPHIGGLYGAGIDASEGTGSGNAQTLVIVQVILTPRAWNEPEAPPPRYKVALAREWRGARPDAFLREVASICHAYGVQSATGDQYAGAANADIARRYGLDLHVVPTTAASKLRDFTDLATYVHTDRIELSPDKQFVQDLLSIKKRVTQQGTTIVLPRTGDGRHADYAPALVAALQRATARARVPDMNAYGGHSDRTRNAGRGRR